MFQPPVFREDDVNIMHSMIRENPLASMVTMQNGDMVCDHIPLIVHPELSEKGTLRGHIARANPIRRHLDSDAQTLIIFEGLHTYVTPS